ncbi:protein SPA1-RELATED 2 [Andrographis paniculata]|uniref:protein SPA1-RELATED 2 n=1 Tax=Andrographis paniculata TaxID=175694 RepID=UPI0021E7F08B|nr:protein SPA1-RELATED 2 [Andrographis paniculata]XP_051119185.1 protein SPA1-RELATED 2 [Andrographis paniculata]XP_051119186.1 protein SPA1-RELATED 2 [Andrographis paniculata]XP_051119187.1 protein SPA1-RELATED 2 [Andrographis paniculata]
MDEAIGEVAEMVDDTHILHRENEFSVKPGSSNILPSNEMVMPGMDVYPEISKNPYSDMLDSKDIDRLGSSEHASASPRCVDGNGIMVEELTLRNYDGDKMAIVGTSGNRERMQTRQNQWQNLYQIAGGSGNTTLRGQTGYKGKGQATGNAWEDGDKNLFSAIIEQNQPVQNYSHGAIMGNLLNNDDKGTPGDCLYTSTGIRTKILSKSGFSEYFIKSTLRGKGVIHKSQTLRGSGESSLELDRHKFGIAGSTNAVASYGLTAKPVSPLSDGFHEPSITFASKSVADGITLREWIEAGGKMANKVEKMRIFRKILDLVDFSHSRGVVLQGMKPSCFKLSVSYQVMYLGSTIRIGIPESATNRDTQQLNHNRNGKRPMHQTILPLDNHSSKKQKSGGNMNFQRWPQFPSRSGVRTTFANVSKADSFGHLSPNDVEDEGNNSKLELKNQIKSFGHNVPDSSQPARQSMDFMLEGKWYSSPELSNVKSCTFASNIYCLGVLLFELLGSFDSGKSHVAAMHDLRHRILPPSFLSENPKEAGFCLWLLHPEPSLRPTTREILQSEFVTAIEESPEGELLSLIDEEDGESDLLLYFLSSLNDQKQKDASKLAEQIQHIEADIQEVEKRRLKNLLVPSSSYRESLPARGISFSSGSNTGDMEKRLMGNMRQLENAYFSMRSNIQTPSGDLVTRRDGELLKGRDNSGTMEKESAHNSTDDLGGFFDGLCKYARYSRFRVRGVLRNGEFNNSANVICSLSFDRDEDYLASGGVSKKIRIYEFQSLFNDSVDIHYPVVEMSNKSKLSCICWNSYIRNYLSSTDYDGAVKLWDASTGQEFSHFSEHSERAWSVDFSSVDPTKLVSGGDDRLVKLWSINQKNSLCTIKSNANVCCVQFSPHSAHLLAFSSADYRTYCYDVRKVSVPWCVLGGHKKAVSFAKFLDSGSIVSASTDNTLKVWDLKRTSSNSVSRDACVLTLRGHTNEKNFVGLSVAADGYITCGSETNEVYAYYRSLPMPISAHKFGSVDPITGKERERESDVQQGGGEDESGGGQFISSVCWRHKSNMVVAANSSGCIKLLQMV